MVVARLLLTTVQVVVLVVVPTHKLATQAQEQAVKVIAVVWLGTTLVAVAGVRALLVATERDPLRLVLAVRVALVQVLMERITQAAVVAFQEIQV